MKILPLIITTATLLISCEKSAQNTAKTSTENSKVTDSAASANMVNAPEKVADGTAVAANTPTAKPSLNPAHGEPFHRCDIAVGAPIDSAPIQNAAPQAMPQQSAGNTGFNTNPISAPTVGAQPSAQATGPKPALNPAHGEPHHRCDLQVGAPLS